MRAVFFCVAALSVTWCDLAWVFLGGAIVAAVARVAVSKTTITMRRLEVARQFIISTYVTGFFTLLARYFSGCASRSISMRLWTEFAKGSNFRNLALFGSGYAGLGTLKQTRNSTACRVLGYKQYPRKVVSFERLNIAGTGLGSGYQNITEPARLVYPLLLIITYHTYRP